jgi:hypothetical protein
MANANAQSSSSSDSFPRFPSSKERLNFPDWRWKAESFLDARQLLDVVNRPVYNPAVPLLDDTSFIGGNESAAKLLVNRRKPPTSSRNHSALIKSISFEHSAWVTPIT